MNTFLLRRGNALSTISLLVKNKARWKKDLSAGRVKIQLGTLLDTCSEDKRMCDGDNVVYMYLTGFP